MLTSLIATVALLQSFPSTQPVSLSTDTHAPRDASERTVVDDLLIQFGAALVGALSGAFIAFRLEDRSKQRSEAEASRARLNRAIQVLGMQLNEMWLIKQQFLDGAEHPIPLIRALKIRPGSNDLRHNDADRVSIDDMLCLMSSPAQIGLVGQALVRDRAYFEFLSTFNQRSELLRVEIQPRLERAGIQEGVETDLQRFRDAMGIRLEATLLGLTDSLVKLVSSGIEKHASLIASITTAGRSMFPGKTVLRIELPDESERTG